jgi:hypothetical protein
MAGPEPCLDRALRPRARKRHSVVMPDHSAAIEALICDAEAAVANQTDPLAVLVMMMRMVIKSDADPYLLNGALIEGVATTIMQRIPAEMREEVSRQVMRLLHDRLRETGAI